MDLNEKEQRLKFLISKLDSELHKFNTIKEKLESKKEELKKEILKLGVDNANITLYEGQNENVLDKVNAHILELKNLRNYFSNELQKTIKQKNLLINLKQKYGDKIKVELTQFGTFKIKYTDDDVENALETTNISKKLIQNLKNSLKENN